LLEGRQVGDRTEHADAHEEKDRRRQHDGADPEQAERHRRLGRIAFDEHERDAEHDGDDREPDDDR
jgi:hypothetical protein